MSATGESPGPFKWLTGKLKSAAVEKAIKKFSIPEDAVRSARSFRDSYGEAAPGDFPTELLILGSSMWSGFALTTFAQQQMLGWVLPYWLRMQSEPSSFFRAPRPRLGEGELDPPQLDRGRALRLSKRGHRGPTRPHNPLVFLPVR